MAPVRTSIRFLLNDHEVEVSDIAATTTLLDYLRLDKRLRGSKEGCAEGDCGACSVLVGRLAGDDLVYESVTSCIRFVGSLDGCHVVTVEHLADADGALHPVQQAMVAEHGSQCGFCTPGIVMSLYGLWMEDPNPSTGAIETALQGNLCRCTGYAPIIRAGKAISTYGVVGQDGLVAERQPYHRPAEGAAGWRPRRGRDGQEPHRRAGFGRRPGGNLRRRAEGDDRFGFDGRRPLGHQIHARYRTAGFHRRA